ncbi:hypothetical protein GGI00_004009, partial [Coemansia sp. RSA 2681]
GAPEALVPQCTRVWHAAASGDDVLPAPLLAEDIRAGRVAGIDAMPAALAQTIARSAATLAAGGSRVIAYALAITDEPLYAPVDAAPAAATTLDVEDAAHPLLPLPSDLVFVGAFAFFDPPQREARPVVQECQDAGIRVILATGDHPSTALSVASAVGIVESHNYHHHNSRAAERLPPPAPPPPLSYGALGSSNTGVVAAAEVHAVTGEMVQRSLALGSFDQLIDESNVFARVSPAQKLRLIHALQARGEVVAFIGDGINDAPSLTRADVGICMGANPSTADVAMDAAGLIVLSGNFSAVVRCLREARRRSANARKCIVFYLAFKLALLLLFALLLLAEGASPMTPVQVIVIKLVADLGATRAILAERSEGLVAKPGEEDSASLTALARVDKITGDSWTCSSVARSVVFYAAALFVACALPLLVPSVLLPSLAVIILASTIPPLSAHLDIVPLDAAEWATVIASPLLMFGGLELVKELRYRWLMVPRANSGIVDIERQQFLSSSSSSI